MKRLFLILTCPVWAPFLLVGYILGYALYVNVLAIPVITLVVILGEFLK